jgi:hypothetical protein
MLNCCSFSKPYGDILIAAGTGKSELRLFDVSNTDDTKQIGCIKEMEKGCMCVDYGN